MQVRCRIPSCGKIFEAPNGKILHALLRQVGWAYRGSQEGFIYYCDEHPPGYGGARKVNET